MGLTGEYEERAKATYKTVEGRELLAAVRQALAELDKIMVAPSSYQREALVGKVLTNLEIAADRYDLFGEKDRRRRKRTPAGMDDVCKNCAQSYVCWFTESDIWNRAVPESGMLCPNCFLMRAEQAGITQSAWKLVPENV